MKRVEVHTPMDDPFEPFGLFPPIACLEFRYSKTFESFYVN